MTDWWIDSAPPVGPVSWVLDAELVLVSSEIHTYNRFYDRANRFNSFEITCSADYSRYWEDVKDTDFEVRVKMQHQATKAIVDCGLLFSIHLVYWNETRFNVRGEEVQARSNAWIIKTREEGRSGGMVDRQLQAWSYS